MKSTTLLLASILSFLTLATPLPALLAGGPAIIPFAANCTLTNPLPHSNGYMAKPSFVSANRAYAAYFDTTRESSAITLQCFEQCNGVSGCKSAFLGYRIPTPEGYYGTSGGSLAIGCIMFTKFLGPEDFVPAPEGQYRNISAVNVSCP